MLKSCAFKVYDQGEVACTFRGAAGGGGGIFVMNLWVRKKQGLGVGVLEINNDKPWSRGSYIFFRHKWGRGGIRIQFS